MQNKIQGSSDFWGHETENFRVQRLRIVKQEYGSSTIHPLTPVAVTTQKDASSSTKTGSFKYKRIEIMD